MNEPNCPDPHAHLMADLAFVWMIVFIAELLYELWFGLDSVLIPTASVLIMCTMMGVLEVAHRL